MVLYKEKTSEMQPYSSIWVSAIKNVCVWLYACQLVWLTVKVFIPHLLDTVLNRAKSELRHHNKQWYIYGSVFARFTLHVTTLIHPVCIHVVPKVYTVQYVYKWLTGYSLLVMIHRRSMRLPYKWVGGMRMVMNMWPQFFLKSVQHIW